MKQMTYRNSFLVLLASLWLSFSSPAAAFSLGEFWNKITGKEFSPEYVAKNLTKGIKDEEAKAREIFNWITHNIAYDVQALQTGVSTDQSVEDIMKSKKGICDDYARLFNVMANSVGLRSTVVLGFVNTTSDSNGLLGHAWNELQIGERRGVVDTTWGSGYYDSSELKYIPRKDSWYFMADPAQISLSHRQEDEKGQPVEIPGFSAEQFKQIRSNTRQLAKLGLPAGELIRHLGDSAEQLLPNAQETEDQALHIRYAPLRKPKPGGVMKFEISHSPNTQIFVRTKYEEKAFQSVGATLSTLEYQVKSVDEIKLVYKIPGEGTKGRYFELLRYGPFTNLGSGGF